VNLLCPHCGAKDVHKSPANERLYLCAPCAMPSLIDTIGDVTGLRVVVRSDLGRAIRKDETMTAFIWASKMLVGKMDRRPAGGGKA
jgi:hypothetical protein